MPEMVKPRKLTPAVHIRYFIDFYCKNLLDFLRYASDPLFL